MIYQDKVDEHKTPAELLEGEVGGVLLHLGKVDVDEVPRLALVLPLRLLLLRHAGDVDEELDDDHNEDHDDDHDEDHDEDQLDEENLSR